MPSLIKDSSRSFEFPLITACVNRTGGNDTHGIEEVRNQVHGYEPGSCDLEGGEGRNPGTRLTVMICDV